MAVLQQLGGGLILLRRQPENHAGACMSRVRPVSISRAWIGAPKSKSKRKAFKIQAVNIENATETEAESGEGVLPSGEWPENFSMLNFEDLSVHFAPNLFKPEAQPATLLADVMSGLRFSVTKDQLLEEIEPCFAEVSGVPVLGEERKCIGVLSRKDLAKASQGLKSPVSEVMSSPAITLSADKTVSDAAVLMLKNKIHRIPIVNERQQVIGMVTRTDIFTALEGNKTSGK